MRGLTARQAEVLAYIRESIAARGFPPTLREIGARMNIGSTNRVSGHLRALERKGLIVRDDMLSRGIHLIDPGPTAASSVAPLAVSNSRLCDLRQQLEQLQAQTKLVERAIELEEQIERGRLRLAGRATSEPEPTGPIAEGSAE